MSKTAPGPRTAVAPTAPEGGKMPRFRHVGSIHESQALRRGEAGARIGVKTAVPTA